MAIASVNGISVAYDDEGVGEVLLLVHGHPFDRRMWRPQVEHVSGSGWRVIAPDLRGYGRSTVVPGTTPLATFARDIAGLLDHLGLGRVVLCGLSMGGQIVLEFHRLFAQRVRGLVLADTFAQAETEDGRKARNAMADRSIREGMAAYAAEVLPKMVTSATIDARPAVAEHVLSMMRDTPPEGAAAALRGRAQRPDYTPTLPHVAVPTLVVVGRDDEFTPVGDARFLHDRIPDSTLEIIEGAAHLPNLERPTAFNDVLERFLTSIGTQAPRPRG
jgi:pimeloyl-ACP methyl ester carboxylesterase